MGIFAIVLGIILKIYDKENYDIFYMWYFPTSFVLLFDYVITKENVLKLPSKYRWVPSILKYSIPTVFFSFIIAAPITYIIYS